MGLVTLGIFTHTIQGVVAAIFLMLAHGLVSSSIVTLLYERHHTRLIKYYRGMTITMPIFATMTLANISCNLAGGSAARSGAFSTVNSVLWPFSRWT